MRSLFPILVSACAVVPAQAQRVVAASGGYFVRPGGSIAFTVGEPVIVTMAAGPVVLTQGFHQSGYPAAGGISEAPSLEEGSVDDFTMGVAEGSDRDAIRVFPNPAREQVWIDRGTTTDATGYRLTDPAGRNVLSGTLTDARTSLDLARYARGPYQLHLLAPAGTPLRTFQLILTP